MSDGRNDDTRSRYLHSSLEARKGVKNDYSEAVETINKMPSAEREKAINSLKIFAKEYGGDIGRQVKEIIKEANRENRLKNRRRNVK